MTKHVLKWTIVAKLEMAVEYDPTEADATKATSYNAALRSVSAKRKALVDLGADLVKDAGKPVQVRE